MTLADDLRAAKALIDTPEKWCSGWTIGVSGEMCAVRALEKHHGLGAMTDFIHPSYIALSNALPRDWLAKWGPNSVGCFNDRFGHADIMALFDRAIAAAERDSTHTNAAVS